VRSPWVIRWPGKVEAGSLDKTHMVSTVDLQPTILEALGLPPSKCDGRSFLPLLRGEKQDGRDAVFAQFHHIHGGDALPMRSVITRESAYVFNPWSNGKRRFGRLGGGAYQAMKKGSREDPALAAWIKHLELRTVEEFYDLRKDPNCLVNLFTAAPDNKRLTEEDKKLLKMLQSKLREWMVRYSDPALESFENRKQPEALERFIQSYRIRAASEVKALRSYEKEKGYRF
jgi:N-sulfoglucosamine sulfohydrolase